MANTNEADVTTNRRRMNRQSKGWRQLYKERRFSVLLVVLVTCLMGPPILLGFGLSVAWFDGLVSLLVLAGILSLCFEPQQRLFALLLGVPSILLSSGGHAIAEETGQWMLFVGHLCQVLFFLSAAVLIIRSMFGSGTLTFDGIFGAVCGYLFLGLAWAVIFSMIEDSQPGSFEMSQSLISVEEPTSTPRQVLTYFSFITLTTIGYGDVLPTSPTTRTCAWIEGIMGQFYLAVIVAGLVSMLVTKARSEGPSEDADKE